MKEGRGERRAICNVFEARFVILIIGSSAKKFK